MLSMSQVIMRLSGPSLEPGETAEAEARFNRLYADYAEPMRIYLKSHFGSQVTDETLEEMHQDLFMKLWSMINVLDERTVRGLLIRLARNAGVDQVRNAALLRRHVEDAPASAGYDADDEPTWIIPGGVDPEQQAIDREALAGAIKAAKSPMRLTVIMLVALGFTTAEMEQVTGLSQSAIKTQLWRFRHEDYPAYAQAQEAIKAWRESPDE